MKNLEEDSVTWSPRVDIQESEEHYLVRADIPGLERDDISVSVENRVLTLKGERRREKTDDRENRLLERAYGQFKRSFRLPSKVENEKIKADYKNGVLTITIPKAKEAVPRKIEIS
jgi:HSP20 family protein